MRVSLKHTHTPSFRSSHSLRTPYTRQNAAFLHSVCIHTHREPALIHISPPLHICGFPPNIHTPSLRSSHSLRTPYTRQNAAFLHSVCIHTHREPALIHISPPLHICGFPPNIHTPSLRSSHSLRTPYTRQNAAFLHSVCIHTHREPALIHISPPLHICGFPVSIT